MSLTTQTIFNGGVQYASPLATAHAEHQFHPLEKHPAYVLGQLLRKAGEKTVARGATLAQKVTSLAQIPPLKMPGILSTIHNSLRRWWLQDTTPCYTNIVASFPGMDEDSRAAVETLCDNSTTQLEISHTQLNAAGVQAIAAALAQNTALTSFSFSSVFCDTTNFAESFSAALQLNGNLKTLNLDLGDTGVTVFIPSPMTRGAAQTFFQYIPCFNLTKIDLGFIDFTLSNAQTLATSLEQPHFPLKELSFSWHFNGRSLDPQFKVVAAGVEKNRCLTQFSPGAYTGLSNDMMLSLFKAINVSQTLASVELWCSSVYSFNATQQQAILAAIEQNPCFLNTFSSNTCFQPEFIAAMQNITQNRTECLRDPLCEVPLTNCSTSALALASSNITQNTAFQATVGGGGSLLVLGSGVLFWIRRKKFLCFRVAEVEQPGAPAEPLPAPRTSNTATLEMAPALMQPLPSPEGQEGEGE